MKILQIGDKHGYSYLVVKYEDIKSFYTKLDVIGNRHILYIYLNDGTVYEYEVRLTYLPRLRRGSLFGDKSREIRLTNGAWYYLNVESDNAYATYNGHTLIESEAIYKAIDEILKYWEEK